MAITIWIKLEIEGDADEAMDAVDGVLDDGTLQDEIHGRFPDVDEDGEPIFAVKSALAHFSPEAMGHNPSDPTILQSKARDAECAECGEVVEFRPDGQPRPHDNKNGERCEAGEPEVMCRNCGRDDKRQCGARCREVTS